MKLTDAVRAGELIAQALGKEGLGWGEGAGHLTCSETDSLVLGLILLDQVEAASDLLYGHTTGDEEGDDHYNLRNNEQAVENYVYSLMNGEDPNG